MKIRALMAVAIVEASTGNIISIPHGGIAEISDELAESLIHDEIAEKYTLISPTGTVSITENGTVDVTEYSSANVNVKDYSAFKALADRDITQVTAEMLDGVTKIGSYAFYSCTSLQSITIPNSVTSIGRNAFQGCSSLPSINIPSSVTSMSYDTFRNCTSLTSVNISNGVSSIGASVFLDCSALTSIDIPNSVTAIGTTAFSGCIALTSIDIPSSVTSIGNYAFLNCSALTSVTVEATAPPTLGTEIFNGTSANLVNDVPASSVDTYKSASGWSDYASKIQAIPST